METCQRTLPNGYTVELLSKSADPLIYEIWEERCYTSQYHLREGDVVVDVGANQGVFSLLAAHLGAIVYAFEPNEMNYRLLCANVDRNGLRGRVLPYQAAVAAADGHVSLFVPAASGDIDPSTFGTTSASWIDSLSGHQVGTVDRLLVRAVSVGTILRDLARRPIALMKIDTEGAEMDILTGCRASDMAQVSRLAMETHNAYLEKDLFAVLRGLGYGVVAHDRLSGTFKTGFLYAEQGARGLDKAVAVLEAPDYALVGQDFAMDAGASFAARAGGDSLGYRFEVDGITGDISTNPVFHAAFDSPGTHRVGVTAHLRDDRGQWAAAGSASEARTIWAFAPEIARGCATVLAKEGAPIVASVDGEAAFVVPADSLPKGWIFEALVLCVKIVEPRPAGLGDPVAVEVDGLRFPVADGYREIDLAGFPNNRDCRFSVRTNGRYDVELQWYLKEYLYNPQIDWGDATGMTKQLDKINVDYVFRIAGDARFVIKRAKFPKDWPIEKVVFGLAKADGDAEGQPLRGVAVVNGVEHELDDWYRKIKTDVADIDGDLCFRIRVDAPRRYQLAWWSE